MERTKQRGMPKTKTIVSSLVVYLFLVLRCFLIFHRSTVFPNDKTESGSGRALETHTEIAEDKKKQK